MICVPFRPRTARTGTALAPGPGRNRRVSLAWPRLPAAVEVALIAVGYLGYALVRLAVKASRTAAFAHAAELWRAERAMHLDIEPSLNHLAAAHAALAEATGYYYGLLNFIITPLVLAWLYLRRPAAFGPLRSALVLSTTAANLVFWTWPAAPPRFAVPGHDRRPGPLPHPRLGRPARPRQPGQPVRRHAQPARGLGRLVRGRRRHRHPRPVAAPGLALPGGHHLRGARLGQPLRPRRRRRPGRHGPRPARRRRHSRGRMSPGPCPGPACAAAVARQHSSIIVRWLWPPARRAG